MQLKQLILTQMRAFAQAEFEFQPGMNLLVGVNGVGKSSVLDALRIMLSQALPKLTVSRSKPLTFGESDIKVGSSTLSLNLTLEVGDNPLDYSVHISRERHSGESIERLIRRQVYSLPKHNVFATSHPVAIRKEIIVAAEQPFAIYFSTRRSLPSMAAVNTAKAVGGQAAAFVDALVHRELRLRYFAEWYLSQQALANETNDPRYLGHLLVLQNAILQFLGTYKNLRAVREPETTLLIDKDNITLDIRQLSDGQRSILAMVFDLAQRLSQANPHLDDPLRDGRAVVLVDELDLHLHPCWQREIVDKLTRTFPNCQFIATTHSPQIVGEVSPGNIIMIEDGQAYRPDQSLGMDTNWILRHLMGVDERDTETKAKIAHIETLIEDDAYEEATTAIDALRQEIGEFPELVGLQTRIDMINFLSEQFDDEAQTEKIEGEENA